VNIREVIAILNRMRTDGIVADYAIGGAVGATFYIEPVATLDVDVFIAFQNAPGSLVIDPRPIYDYLKARGGMIQDEYIVVSGWPLQFLPPGTPLVEEALRDAVERDVDGMPVRVFTAEHLGAIALQTGRAKDKARLLQFIEEGALDADRFRAIVVRHQLAEKWARFERHFLHDQP
jgi:hypothetical protein